MTKEGTFCGTYVHSILARLLRGQKSAEPTTVVAAAATTTTTTTATTDIICANEVPKLRCALRKLQLNHQLVPHLVEHKLQAFGITGRCDVIFKCGDDRHTIVDWKFRKNCIENDHYQLNIYRLLYSTMYTGNIDMAVVNIYCIRGNFHFDLTAIPVMDDRKLWGMINCCRQQRV